ncbi:MAG: D-alanyl-D-alanine carboxypeptidase family protein [Bacilli bacterium]
MKLTKKIYITIFAILLVLCIVFVGNKYYIHKKEKVNTKEDTIIVSEFEQAGFDVLEQDLITSKLKEDQIKLVLNSKYDKELLIALLKEKYFINDNLDRYVAFYTKDNTKSFSEIIKDVNSNIDYEFYTEQVPTDTTKEILMIANKHYALSEDFEGLDIVPMDNKYSYYNLTYKLNKEAYGQFEKMWNAAKKEGLDFGVYSGYRSYKTQVNLYNGYVNKDGKELADTYSARPGNSEHQTGLAVDLKSRTDYSTIYFEKTKEYAWLQENSYKYGFIMRYPLGEEYITGYQYEPWHYRYCGVECATYIHENNITFEEYYEYYVKDK